MNDPDTGSESAFSLAISWLEICLNDHPKFTGCSDSRSALPSRVLDVGYLTDHKSRTCTFQMDGMPAIWLQAIDGAIHQP